MKVIVLYKSNNEYESRARSYSKEFLHRTGKSLDFIDAESREGVSFAKVYDILQFPALIAIKESGELIEKWTELEKWPTFSELSYYTQG